ncbi:jg11807 [Pararge aegeria aegeria]|uniref:Jg11807 protein n=1 Tax=Pararge aegeria aegeria TaxID=348720 RepID=A0A8S4SA79_9NEOP|nr:jg11807 [Pararge aegeria aegeria]
MARLPRARGERRRPADRPPPRRGLTRSAHAQKTEPVARCRRAASCLFTSALKSDVHLKKNLSNIRFRIENRQ